MIFYFILFIGMDYNDGEWCTPGIVVKIKDHVDPGMSGQVGTISTISVIYVITKLFHMLPQ